MNHNEIQLFREEIWHKGGELFRPMPWRETTDPYFILVSEMMLQQTQVNRVVPKFLDFVEQFPTVTSLAGASLGDVLALWSGLGYNRRAKYLHQAAQMIERDFNGAVPQKVDDLQKLPGVGKNTAGAIQAYAFNQPSIFIETNVRSVYMHHFFRKQHAVHDNAIKALLEATIDTEHPREWYWALMDYGSWLKQQGYGDIKKSQHYKKQPAFKGSVREVRGYIIRTLLNEAPVGVSKEGFGTITTDERFSPALEGLERDKLVIVKDGRVYLTNQ